MSTFLEVRNVYKTYQMGEIEVPAAQGMSFSIEEGDFVVILGPSGSGKSTILNIIGGMDRPTSGEVFVNGLSVHTMNDKALTLYRRACIGFVFQFYNLMPNLTALENVTLITEVADKPLSPRVILETMGLGDRLNNFPAQLSGGEQQRVAIARALAKNPALLLCDEPTGALDYETGIQVLRSLFDVNRLHGKTVVIITHNVAIAQMAHKVIRVHSGKIQSVTQNLEQLPPEGIEW